MSGLMQHGLKAGVDAYFDKVEADIPNLRPAARKRVVWAGGKGERTPLSVVYLHGFSASAEEIRPVPDRVAEALGANLIYTRFKGHGRDGDAMAEARVRDWMADTAEALAAGRAVGEEVLVIATSTGASIATAALVQAGYGKSRERGCLCVAQLRGQECHGPASDLALGAVLVAAAGR